MQYLAGEISQKLLGEAMRWIVNLTVLAMMGCTTSGTVEVDKTDEEETQQEDIADNADHCNQDPEQNPRP